MDERTGFENRSASDVTSCAASTSESAPDKLASYLALLSAKCPDLATVAKAWPDLPEPVKAGILAMVKAADAGGC